MISQVRFAQSLRRLVLGDRAASDAELLRQFLAGGDEEAFTAIVRRHGAMVLGVCRRVLRHAHDAEDAFQATFLVLARRADAIGDRAALANWLYGVAYRTALKARAIIARRTAKEMEMASRVASTVSPEDELGELEILLDGELQRLKDKYRLPVVLCDLEGLSRKAAAQRLGVSEGTLSGQLFRARRMLAERLRRHGLALSAGAVATMLGQANAAAAPSAAMIQATAKAGVVAAKSPAALAGMVSSTILSLTTGVIKTMYAHKLKQLAAFFLALVAALGIGWASYATGAAVPAQERDTPAVEPAPAEEKKPEMKENDEASMMVQLLRNRKVLRNMKCTVEQWDRLEDILEAADADIQKASAAMQNVPPPVDANGNPDFEQMGKNYNDVMQQSYSKATKEISTKVLKVDQVKRLAQLDLQGRGVSAFQLKRVVEAIKLTDKQQGQVKELIEKSAQEVQAVFQPNPVNGQIVIDGNEIEKAVAAIEVKTRKATEELLTADQKKSWADLIGPPAAFPLNPAGSRVFINGGNGVINGGFQIMPAPRFVPGVPAIPALPPAQAIPFPPVNVAPPAAIPPAVIPDPSGVIPANPLPK